MKMIIFLLGGPGAGKSTQADLLAKHPKVACVGAGDCLRAEMNRAGSEHAAYIKECIANGVIVDGMITAALLHDFYVASNKEVIIIDGFPRSVNNYNCFLKIFGETPHTMLTLSCSEETLRNRIRQRILSKSTRIDDNEETLMKRIAIYNSETQEIYRELDRKGMRINVEATNNIEETHQRILNKLAPYFE